ncbi:MAG TPA: DUF4387 domain-containing protein [Bacillota bacterium]|jgi:hypothetical protein|nr:DUF4387 domain-containing protein [Bacillota bacterium]HOJ83106.1 DUF4387 domain-containing protein [Bacillota bacterium]HOL15701.1 DUF4387 domain-containing protein [Bacillota bacterium]HPZ11242.1 DUF4387 domain-containing protein [Bacillota bacterium]HQE09328.1 DUF4387 domain-containing protein [Bacillota bacterium]
MKPLVDLALVIRSKNAGPFELTIDIIFKERDVYERVKEQQLLNAALIARLYRIPEEDVISVTYFDPTAAFKATMKRQLPSGNLGEKDIYGAQQHAPLLELLLPWSDADAAAS